MNTPSTKPSASSTQQDSDFDHTSASDVPPPPPPPPRIANPSTTGQPWNPKAIALLGLVLTPLWAGVMAAINTKRLNLTGAWKPMVIGIGWLTAHIVVLLTPFNFYMIQLPLIAVGAWLVWCHALHVQIQPFAGRGWTKGSWVDWVIPGAAGLAGATFTFCPFVLTPALPDSPNQVCDHMLHAEPETRNEFLTERMAPAKPFLDWLVSNMAEDFSLSQGYIDRDLEKRIPEMRGGCIVDFHFRLTSGRYPNRCIAFFFLIRQHHQWRIDEAYFTVIGDQNLDAIVPLTKNATEIRNHLEPPVRAPTWPSQFSKPFEFTRIPIHTAPTMSGNNEWKDGVTALGRLILLSGIAKKAIFFVIMLALGKVGYNRIMTWWHGQKQHSFD